MNFLKRNLTLVAFFAAVLTAFAFNAPKADEAQMLFGKLDNGQWVQIKPGYICEDAEQRICTAELVNNDPQLGEPIPGTEEEGRYNPAP